MNISFKETFRFREDIHEKLVDTRGQSHPKNLKMPIDNANTSLCKTDFKCPFCYKLLGTVTAVR